MWKRLVFPACSFRMFEILYLRQCRMFTFVHHYASRDVSCGMSTKVCRACINYLNLSCFLLYTLTVWSRGRKVTFGNTLCTFNFCGERPGRVKEARVNGREWVLHHTKLSIWCDVAVLIDLVSFFNTSFTNSDRLYTLFFTTEGEWKWSDGDVMNLPTSPWHYWYPGEPDDADQAEDCAVLTNYRFWHERKLTLDQYYWRDYSCSVNPARDIQGYVCEGK